MHRYAGGKLCTGMQGEKYAQVCRGESMHRYAGGKVCTGMQGGKYAQVCRGESMHRYAGGKVWHPAPTDEKEDRGNGHLTLHIGQESLLWHWEIKGWSRV